MAIFYFNYLIMSFVIEKWVCISNLNIIKKEYDFLTVGKVYDVTTYTDSISTYICDKGIERIFNADEESDNFITLDEWRNRQLDKLL